MEKVGPKKEACVVAAKCGNTGNAVQVTVFVNEISYIINRKYVILIVLAFSVLGISKKHYWQCVKDGGEIDWECSKCSQQCVPEGVSQAGG